MLLITETNVGDGHYNNNKCLEINITLLFYTHYFAIDKVVQSERTRVVKTAEMV